MKPKGRSNADGLVYDGFLSYSHAVDGKLTPVMQIALQRFATPWYRTRTLRIFRDNASLSASPHLWSSIQTALASSRWFILMASPTAAASMWVDREVAYWCRYRSPEHLLIVLTDGEMKWEPARNDFDWALTTALPPSLRGVFEGEPRHVDLRWANDEELLSARHPRFKDAVADIAAPLRGCSKEDLFGEDVRHHRRTQRLLRAVIAVLTTLAVLVASSAVVAVRQRNVARRERDIAASRYIAAQAVSHRESSLSRALLESIEALNVADTAEARRALFGNLQSNPRIRQFIHDASGPITFSPNGTALAFAHGDQVAIVDISRSGIARSLLPLPRRETRKPSIQSLAFNAGGDLLVAATDEGLVMRWHADTTRPVGDVLDVGPDASVAVAPDARILAAASKQRPVIVTLWDLDAHRPFGRLPTEFPFQQTMSFSSDSRILATGSPVVTNTGANDGSISVWDVTTSRRLGPLFRGIDDRVYNLALNGDGSLLASGEIDGTVLVWSVTDGSERYRLVGHTRSVSGLAFTPDSSTLISTSDDSTAILWDMRSGRLRDRLREYGGGIGSPTVGKAGALLAVAGGGTIVLWDLGTPLPRLAQVLLPGGVPVVHLSFSSDGRVLATAREDGRVVLWDVAEGREKESVVAAPRPQDGPDYQPFVRSLFSAKGSMVTLEDDNAVVSLWKDGPAGLRGQELDVSAPTNSSGAFSPDGRLLALGTNDGAVIMWDVGTRQSVGQVPSDGSGNRISEVVFSPNGKLLAILGHTKVRIWDVNQRHFLRQELILPPSPPTNIVFDLTGRELTVGFRNGTVQVWQVASGKVVEEPTAGRPSTSQRSLAVSRDGRLMATGDSDGSILLWNVGDGAPFGPALVGHTDAVRGLIFSPDGTTLASGGDDGAVILWKVDVPAWRKTACELADRQLKPEEWVALVGRDRDYNRTCP